MVGCKLTQSLQYLEEFELRLGTDASVWQTLWLPRGIVAGVSTGNVDVVHPISGALVPNEAPTPHQLGVVALSSNHDGECVLSSSIDGVVALWHWDNAVLRVQKTCSLEQATIEGNTYATQAWATALDPSGRVFAAAGDGLAPALFSASPDSFGEGIAHLSVAEGDAVGFALKLAFNHDGSLLALGTSVGTVLLFDVARRVQVAAIADHAQPVRALCFSAPHTAFAHHLFVGSDDRTTTVHDLEGLASSQPPSTVTALQGHQGWILDVQSGGDGRIVATCGSDAAVQLWDLGASPVTNVATFTQTTAIWALAWKPYQSKTHEQEALSTQLLDPGSDFATGSDDGFLRRYRNAGVANSAQVDP